MTTSAATTALVYPASTTALGATLVLAHGAGAGQRSALLVDFSRRLSHLGLDIVTFDFLYSNERRRVPDRQPALEACYRAAIEAARRAIVNRFLFIGGKSMGGRIATHVAAADANLAIAGLVLLGYPLHPPGRPDERRDAHLGRIGRPMLIVQGSRDTFGTPAELEPIVAALTPTPTLHVVEGGDHSFKVGRKAAPGQAAVYEDIQRTIAAWVQSTVDAFTTRP